MATGHYRNRGIKNGKTSWQLTVECDRDPITGKRDRHYKTINGTKKEAESALRKMILQYETGSPVKQSSLKLKDWMQQWLNLYLPNIEGTTRESYTEKINTHIIPELGHIPLKALNTATIQTWINKLHQEKNLAPKSVRNIYLNLNAALEQAVTLRMIPYNPTAGVVLPKREKYTAEIYDKAEVDKMLNVAKGTDFYIPLLLAVYVGLRRGELVALKWSDIDLDKGIIHVRHNAVMVNGELVIKAPKSAAGIRDVAIGNKLVTELRKEKLQYNKNKIAHGKDFVDSDLVICKPNGEGFRPDSITQKWDRFVERNNLKRIRFHDLRHTCATLMAQAGVSPKTAQERLGHADVSVTMNIYTHSTERMNRTAATLLDTMI